MRKIWILISIIVIILIFQGCGSETTYWQNWEAPNWTDDGKIVFLEDTGEQKIDNWGAQVGGREEITLYEINNDGSNLREIREIASCEFDAGPVIGAISTSSAGDWVVLSIEDWRRGDHYPVMYTIKRNGDSLSEIGSGRNPDFSPDASKIVYEKPDEGIWIMDRDGENDRQIISDTDARYPAWSPDGDRVAYINDSLFVSDTNGLLSSIYSITRIRTPDWGPVDTNAVSLSYDTPGSGANIVVVYINSSIVDTTNIISGNGAYWSFDGGMFIGYDGTWFVINRNGTGKWYLQQ